MHRDGWKVMFGSASGAGIGGLVALEIAPFFWWVGLLAGAFAGYLLFAPIDAISKIPKAYRAARGWNLPLFYGPGIFVWFLYGASCGSWFILVGCLMDAQGSFDFGVKAFLVFTSIYGFMGTGLCFYKREEELENLQQRTSALFHFAWKVSPPAVVFWHIPRFLIKNTISFGRWSKFFMWEFFCRIHSESGSFARWMRPLAPQFAILRVLPRLARLPAVSLDL